ncbi:hypothetical protein [Flavobacterium chilense]|uniref:ATP synthase F0 sector subunit C n=1 Tax=Flavobacterium chilense TaxID=946677 RepID=A0A1M7IZ37_9FLAO|nr:hypothetical protein [Flavobacterium chilense]SHM46104.1 hypothetical protein SAMN05444484_106111 [Flavobacterium chilense]
MENQKVPVFTFSIVAIILVSALYKQFDFETLKFEKPALAILYIIVLSLSISVLIKSRKRNSGK